MTNLAYVASVPRMRSVPPGLLVFGALAAAILVGIAAAVNPVLAVAGVLALAIVPVVLIRPIVGLAALVLMSFLEEVSAQTGALSVTKLLGAALLASWLAFVMTSRGERWDGLLAREPLLVATIVLFVAWACMSFVWAEAPELAQNSVQRFVLNFTLFPIALVAIRAPRHVILLVITFVAGALIAAAWGINAGRLGDPEMGGRLKGAGINPNQLGSYLVVAMVFATALASNRRWSSLARAIALSAAALAAVGVFLTLSRGALVGMAVALLLAPFVVGAGRRAGTVVLVLVAVIGVGAWYGAVAPASAVDRVTKADGGTGREDLWRVGWRMVEDKPVHGVGAGNFPEAAIHYLLRPGATDNDDFIVDDKKVAHNIYLTVLSELGVVGLLLFVVLVGLCLRSALRAARAFERLGDQTMEMVSRALFISLVSLLVVGFFSSALYVKQLWFLLAMAPALLALADRASAARAGRPDDSGLPIEGSRRAAM
jgi:O-antigen ligase